MPSALQSCSLTVTAALLAAGIAHAAESAPSAEAAAAVTADAGAVVAAAGSLAPLPDLDPAQWFDGNFGGTFGAKTVTALPKTRKVAVAGFRVVFVNQNVARAISRASYLPGRDTGSAKSKTTVNLVGVDDATLQAITDRAYQTFLQQLAASGRELVPAEQMQTFFGAIKAAPVPYSADSGWGGNTSQTGRGFSPTGLPLWFQTSEAFGDAGLGQTNMRAFNELSVAAGSAITLAPLIVVDFAQMQSSGNRSSLMQRTAATGAVLAMSIPMFSTRVVRAEEVRWGGIVSKGDDGALAMTQALDTDVEFAALVDATPEESTGSKLGSALLSLSGINSKKTVVEARTSNDAYRLAAEAVLGQATGTFAKLFAQHPAS